MKRTVFMILTGFIVFAGYLASAQNESHEARIEKFRTEKIAFLTSKLELTPAEAEKFWPIYNQFEKERWEAQMSRRDLEDKVRDAEENLSEAEVIKLTRDFAQSMQKEGAMATSYNEKFLKVLPPKKVLKLYKAENEFRMNMIRRYRDNDKGPK